MGKPLQHRAVRIIGRLPLLISEPSVRPLHRPPNSSITYMRSAVGILPRTIFVPTIQDFHASFQTFRVVVRVALRHDRRLMPEQPLHLVEAHACLDESRGERMPEIVGSCESIIPWNVNHGCAVCWEVSLLIAV